MREKYESLSVSVLKELAKARGIKSVSAMKKSQVIEAMLALDEKEGAPAQEMIAAPEKKVQEAPAASAEADVPERTAANQEPMEQETPAEQQERGYEHPQGRSYERQYDRSQPERSGQAERGRTGDRTERPAGRYVQNRTRRYQPDRSQSDDRTSERNYERPSERSYDRPAERNYERQTERSYGSSERTERVYDRQPERSYERQPDRVAERQNPYMEGSGDHQERSQQEREESARPPMWESDLDSGIIADGILEVMQDGYGFIRCENFMPGENDVYVSPSQIRKFNLKTGDILRGNTRIKTQGEKFSALLYLKSVNGLPPYEASRRANFEDMTPIFPNQRIRLERNQSSVAMRITDLIAPIGKGQRGMIVSQPKAGKTTLLKDIAKSILANCPQMHLMILLIDERPEEVTDIKEAIQGDNVEVIYSTFDELPEHHKRVSEMVIERAKRLVEHKRDVVILLDSITRLARAYNLTVPPSGRTLSGGLDPAALHMPKRFFGAARNMREGGSLTILATALVETGSKMDDVVFEEFKGTGNMELVLDRKLSEKRVFPAIDIARSGTRREDLLLDREEQEAVDIMRKELNGMRQDEAVENILNLFARTRNNREFIQMVKKTRLV